MIRGNIHKQIVYSSLQKQNAFREKHKKRLDKSQSVFKEWKEDNAQSLKKMLESDLENWKITRFVKSQEDVNKVQNCVNQFQKYFEEIKKVFIYYASQSSFPTITMLDFCNLCQECNMIDKNLNISTIDRLFIATNVELIDMVENPDNELNRFEMLEILVRIAGQKYKDSTKSYSEGLKLLLNQHILPKSREIYWQEFRDDQLWTYDVNNLFEINLDSLKKLFNKYSLNSKGYMLIKEAQLLIKQSDIELSEKDVKFCFGMSKMSVINENSQSKFYTRMMFVEFLEFIGRIADFLYRKHENMELTEKIKIIIDKILPLVNLKRRNHEHNHDFY